MTSSIIYPYEKEDYEELLKEKGIPQKDFKLSIEEDPMGAEGAKPITGRITLTHLPSKKSRTYDAGYYACWVEDFGYDLDKDVFS